jgi:hypothetical protein
MDQIRETFLRFDVSSLGSGQSAVLILVPTWVVLAEAPVISLAFESVANDTWTQTGVTWNNKPASSGTPFASITGVTEGVPISIDVTALAQAAAASDDKLSIRIRVTNPGTNRAVAFGSTEIREISSAVPYLYIGTLAAPSGLTATATSSSRISLSWNPAYGASSYRVERATGGGAYQTIATDLTGTNYLDADLTHNTTYAYRVISVNAAGESTASSPVNATTLVSIDISPEADSYVEDDTSAGTNFGTSNLMWVKYDETAAAKTRIAYLRFDVHALEEAESVILSLRPLSLGAVSTDLLFHSTTTNTWGETTINWNNRPASTGSPLATVATSDLTAGQTFEVDVTDIAKAQAVADGFLTIAISSPSNASNRFATLATKEHTDVPSRPLLVASLNAWQEVLVNGGFENSFSGWVQKHATLETTQVRTGTKAARLSAYTSYKYFHQDKPLTAGEQVQASGYLKASGVTGVGGLQIRFLDSSGATLVIIPVGSISGTGNYTHIQSAVATAPAGTVSVRLQGYINANAGGNIYFDDLSLLKM